MLNNLSKSKTFPHILQTNKAINTNLELKYMLRTQMAQINMEFIIRPILKQRLYEQISLNIASSSSEKICLLIQIISSQVLPPLSTRKKIFCKKFAYSNKIRTFALANEKHRGVEQLVARWAHNPKVVCSSQASATKYRKKGDPQRPPFLLYSSFPFVGQ